MVALFMAGAIVLLLFVDLFVQYVNRKYYAAEAIGETKSLETYEFPIDALSFNTPSNFFHSSSHLWLKLIPTGELMVGIDELMGKLIGKIERIMLPEAGKILRKGDVCCLIEQKNKIAHFVTPFEGVVTYINPQISKKPQVLTNDPYNNWLFFIKPLNVTENLMTLKSFKTGADANLWLNSEVKRIQAFVNKYKGKEGTFTSDTFIPGMFKDASSDVWNAFESQFLNRA